MMLKFPKKSEIVSYRKQKTTCTQYSRQQTLSMYFKYNQRYANLLFKTSWWLQCRKHLRPNTASELGSYLLLPDLQSSEDQGYYNVWYTTLDKTSFP